MQAIKQLLINLDKRSFAVYQICHTNCASSNFDIVSPWYYTTAKFIRLYNDKEFISWLTTLTQSASSIIPMIDASYQELHDVVMQLYIFYKSPTQKELYEYKYTDDDICSIIEQLPGVRFTGEPADSDCTHTVCKAHYSKNWRSCGCSSHVVEKRAHCKCGCLPENKPAPLAELQDYYIICITRYNAEQAFTNLWRYIN